MNYKVHPDHPHVTVFSMHGIEIGDISHSQDKYKVVFYFSDMKVKNISFKHHISFKTFEEAMAFVEENVTESVIGNMPIEDFGVKMQIPKLKEVIFRLVAGKEMEWLHRGIVAAIMDEFEPCCPKCGGYEVKEVGKLIWCAECHEHYSTKE